MKVRDLKDKAREYFYADNFADLEDVMITLGQKSPTEAAKLRREFEDFIMEVHLLDEVGAIGGEEW